MSKGDPTIHKKACKGNRHPQARSIYQPHTMWNVFLLFLFIFMEFYMSTTTLNSLDKSLEKLESTFSNVEGDRSLLISKMRSIVAKCDIDPVNDAPRMIETKLQILNTFDNLLKSAESSAVTAAKTQMQRKNDESSEMSRQMVVEMLKNINSSLSSNTSSVVIPVNGISEAVNKACKETNHPIDDGELSIPDVPLKDVE